MTDQRFPPLFTVTRLRRIYQTWNGGGNKTVGVKHESTMKYLEAAAAFMIGVVQKWQEETHGLQIAAKGTADGRRLARVRVESSIIAAR